MPRRNLSFHREVATPGISASTQVIFCDFDGPIVDVSERYYRTYRQGLLAICSLAERKSALQPGLTPLSKEQFWRMKQSRIADIEIAVRSGIPIEWFERYMQQVEEIVNHPRLLRWDRLQPSAQAAMKHIKQADMRLVLVTLRQPRQVNTFLRSQGLTHLVDEVYGADDKKAAHRNRVTQKSELLARAIAQQKAQGYATEDSWMVGDTEADVIAAKTLGLPSAALSCGVRSADYLKALEPTGLYSELLSAAQSVVKETRRLQAA